MNTGNQPYVKIYSKDAITPENPKGLTNPIAPEGYLHTQPSTREVKRMLKQRSLNSRAGRVYNQLVWFYKDSEGNIIKHSEEFKEDEVYTFHTRTISHKTNYLRNLTNTGPKDYTPRQVVIIKEQ